MILGPNLSTTQRQMHATNENTYICRQIDRKCIKVILVENLSGNKCAAMMQPGFLNTFCSKLVTKPSMREKFPIRSS